MTSEEYWREREEIQRKKNITDEAAYSKEIQQIYASMMDNIQKEIHSFYAKYAAKEGITMAEAKKKVSQLDMETYSRKAKKYVKDRDFSDEANEEMRLYNLTMKVNRLEMLKANIGLELVNGFDELEKYFDQKLTDRTLEEFQRQAGILGESVQNNQKFAHAIVNASFHDANFSERVWMHQNNLKSELAKELQTGLIQGRSSIQLARNIRKKFAVSQSDSERLMTTELRRVQTEAAKQSYERNGNTEYVFLTTNPKGPCSICRALDGKVFKVKDMLPGKNAPPIHPRCHCTTAPHWNQQEFDRYLDEENRKMHERMEAEKGESRLKSPKNKGIIKLPRYQEAVLPETKFSQYALNPEKNPDKARAFETALGYTLENVEDLIRQTQENLPEFSAKEKGYNGFGVRYEVVMKLKGPNGKTAKVLTAWIDDEKTGETRLTSVYVDKE